MKANDDATWKTNMVASPTLSNVHDLPNSVSYNFSKNVGAHLRSHVVCGRNNTLNTSHFNHARLLMLMGISYIQRTMSSRPLLIEHLPVGLGGSYIAGTEDGRCYLSPGSIRRGATPPLDYGYRAQRYLFTLQRYGYKRTWPQERRITSRII